VTSEHTIGVGGWLVRAGGEVCLVRMTYGPAAGRLMIPGGHLDPGEALDAGALREVAEETGIAARCDGLLMVRQRLLAPRANLYLVFALSPCDDFAGRADRQEVSEVVWLTPRAVLARDDVQPIAAEVARAWLERRAVLASRELDWQREPGYRLWSGAA
jgi:ADP-ribose pyrophosphatase YjhB (NUDIX family)